MNPRLFPFCVMVLQAAAAVVYACQGCPRKALIWSAGAILSGATGL